jgi:hypothetical protein
MALLWPFAKERLTFFEEGEEKDEKKKMEKRALN